MKDMKVFPSWRYHPTLKPTLIHSAGDDEKLNAKWRDTPYGPPTHPSAPQDEVEEPELAEEETAPASSHKKDAKKQ